MAISTRDRVAAMEIACRAERDSVERAERSGNPVAAAINRQRLQEAERRLSAAMERAQSDQGEHTMQTIYEDGLYWTHPTFGPSRRAAWRKVEIKNGVVRVIDPNHSEYGFNQPSFFDVNTMVCKVGMEEAPCLEPA